MEAIKKETNGNYRTGKYNTEIKNFPHGLNSRVEMAEDKTSKLEE